MPIIRCPQGNAAEMISERLDSKLRDYFMNSRGGPSNAYAIPYQERPGTISQVLLLTISYGYT